ncbi:4-diphosphocytidyl-2C-methyl-D-erythritol synthase [Roseisolibacter agri]|uniref:4-diphosphocytidyl-2C-methyl-D-erythritol synthase n=1 Tax=Roseisolibacter agri TaxID=2014610 RepID=A0AA37Q413_9BACT|nr:4-diphosphocytidyl-2C-methyl-D-erythritol synthase [Roseisolibacter agri]
MRVGAVVLAAGASTRLGTPKQLLLHEGEPLVRRAARAVLEAGATPVVVVLGAESERVRTALDGLAGIELLVNERWSDGLATSLTSGVRTLLAIALVDAVLLTLADQPLVGAPELAALVARLTDSRGIVAAEYAGIVGVPAVVAREHVDALLGLSGDRGAGAWLRSLGDHVVRVPMPAAAMDVDTPSDAARLAAGASDSTIADPS